MGRLFSHCTLRHLFELRKTRSLLPRRGLGRLFFFEGKAGLCDATGCLWPVSLPNAEGHHGQILEFECFFSLLEDTELDFGYGNFQYHLSLTSILTTTPSHGKWENILIPEPLPEEAFLKTQLTKMPAETHPESCRWFSSPASLRRRALHNRNRALDRTRRFFENRGFLHMETPILVPSGGVETYLQPFSTEYHDHRGKSHLLQLPTSPEFSLKKLLSEGYEKIFQISHAFRNSGELSFHHEPDFLMLEWYRSGSRMEEVMEDTRHLVLALAKFLGSRKEVPPVWQIFRVDHLFQKLTGLELSALQDTEVFRQEAAPLSTSITETDDWDTLFCKIFMEKIEPFLQKQEACFVTHYPLQMGALATRDPTGKPFVERFEAFLFGVEICNGYTELTDADELISRFSTVEPRNPVARRDPIFESTMKYGLPPCAGNALGIDRVIALLAGLDSIQELFPLPFASQFPSQTIALE